MGRKFMSDVHSATDWVWAFVVFLANILGSRVEPQIRSSLTLYVRSHELRRSQYTEANVDVTQEIEQRAQQAAQAGADHCALCSISCVTSTLASV